MSNIKLDLSDLDVASFATGSTSPIQKLPTLTTTDPTAQTHCFVCPPATADCWVAAV